MKQPDIINREGQKGFTLIEIIIAMFVFTIGALGVATMQISSIQGNTKGRSITEASVMGTNVYEELFTLPYNHALLLDVDGNGAAGLNDGFDGGGAAFRMAPRWMAGIRFPGMWRKMNL